MRTWKNNSKMDNFTYISKSQNGGNTIDATNDAEWYVCRYRTLTQEILKLETAKKSNLNIFLPVAKELSPNEKQNCRNSRPVIPGFIFIRGSINDIKNDCDLCHYPIMHTNGDIPRPISISKKEMKEFIRIASMLAKNPELIYSEEFEQSSRNIVEFVEDGEETKFAFIETLQGVNGGNLIVPIRQDEIAKAIYLKKNLNEFKLRPHTLCYKISAAETMFSVRHIAHGNKYDLDYINTANKKASIALQHFEKGEVIDENTKGKMREYLHRYRNAVTDSIKFQAKIYLMLYKCSTVLQLKEESQQLKERIESFILPEYDKYVKSVRKDKRPTTLKNLERFKQTFENTKAIEESM